MSEVAIYLEEKVEGAQVDPLDWWCIYESRFPNLSRMVRDYLAIPATSVPSERCFSIAGSVLTTRGAAMTEGMANSIMCCKYWLGFNDELAHQDMVQERKLAEGLEGDLSIDIDSDHDNE